MNNKNELNPNVTRNDIIAFVQYIKIKAIESIYKDNASERLSLQRELFLDEKLNKQIVELAIHCAKIDSIVKDINLKIKKNKYDRYCASLSVLVRDCNEFDSLEERVLNLFSHKRLSDLLEIQSKKITETNLAYGTILATLKNMRSPAKMGEYLLSMGFDVSKIEAKTPIKNEKPIKPVFTKEVLFPCLKDGEQVEQNH